MSAATTDKGVTTIDILHLVDRLEELLDHGWRLPLANRVAIDEDMFLNIVDQMRISIPQEIKEAREIQQERDKYVAQAHDEARSIIAQAREDAARALDEHDIRVDAQAQADEMLEKARTEALRVRRGADDYAESKLRELAHHVAQLQAVIQNGLKAIDERRAEQRREAEQGDVPADVQPGDEEAAD